MLAVEPGKYVVAVSGGVDSVALLHMLTVRPGLQLTVAHFDHGIREDAAEDRKLVEGLAHMHGLKFVYAEGNLGAGASEALARKARYDFLHRVRESTQSSAIITAHHQDDLLETAILNMIRGTGRRGLSSLGSSDIIKRPLLHLSKADIKDYAAQHDLQWREDSTNVDDTYLRNYVRLRVLPRFSEDDREALLGTIQASLRLNQAIRYELTNYLHVQPQVSVLDRHQFIMLPYVVAREVMAEWLLLRTDVELSRNMLERLVVAAKTGRIGSRLNVSKTHWLQISRTKLALIAHER